MNVPRALIASLAVAAGLSAVPAAHAGIATDEMVSCAALGPKHPGNTADRQQGDHIAERFRAAGLQVSAEEFHMPVWKPGRTTLSIAAGPGAGSQLEAQSFAYSGTGHVRAEVVDAGDGQPDDFDGKDVKGKIVLVVNGGAYHRTVQVENIMARGGIGMVYVSASPKNLIQTGAVRWGQRPPASIPTVTIGAYTGAQLREKLAQGAVTLDMTVEGERVDAVTRDIVGFRPGTTYPDKYIVVAGHYDSWYAGANDNCSAIGTLLSVAEANKDMAPAYNMIYIGWGAEEPGLVGSYTWLWRNQKLVPDIALNVNLEETATAAFDDQGTSGDGKTSTLTFGSTSPAMNALVAASAAPNQVVPPVNVPVTAERLVSGGIIATDLEGFYAQGVQAISTASSSPYYHTTGDTSDTVNPKDLEFVTAYIRDFTRAAQLVPPAGLQLREVPTVSVNVPSQAAAGAELPIDITVVGPLGEPISGDGVRVLVDQRDNWAVTEGYAEKLGNGRYRYVVPAGMLDADVTRIRATTSTNTYLANGFATVDMRGGGLLPAGSACRSKRVVTLHVRRVLRGGKVVRSLRATASRGQARVRRTRGGYAVRLDLRGVGKGQVKVRLTAATSRGRVVQTRLFRTCS